MKYVIYFLMLFAVAMMVVSATLIDFSNAFGEESSFGLIGFMVSLCSLILLGILLVSRALKERYESL